MDLEFVTSGGGSFKIEVGYFDTVLEIKEKIQKYKGIPISTQTLIFNGAFLRDDLNVHFSDILDHSRLHLNLSSDASPPKIRLLLRLPTSKLLAVDADARDTIHRLKERIHEIEGTPAARLSIHASGNELPDHRTVLDCELSENSDLTVGFRPPPPSMNAAAAARPAPANLTPGLVKLRVVAQYGCERIPVEVCAAENVGELRKKLQKMKSNLLLPKEGFFFIHKQNVMDDDRTFRWHRVTHGDTIEIFSGSISGGS